MPTIDKHGALHAANGQYTFKPGNGFMSYDLGDFDPSLDTSIYCNNCSNKISGTQFTVLCEPCSVLGNQPTKVSFGARVKLALRNIFNSDNSQGFSGKKTNSTNLNINTATSVENQNASNGGGAGFTDKNQNKPICELCNLNPAVEYLRNKRWVCGKCRKRFELYGDIVLDVPDLLRGDHPDWPVDVQGVTLERWNHILENHGPKSTIPGKDKFLDTGTMPRLIFEAICYGKEVPPKPRAGQHGKVKQNQNTGSKERNLQHNNGLHVTMVAEIQKRGQTRWFVVTSHPKEVKHQRSGHVKRGRSRR